MVITYFYLAMTHLQRLAKEGYYFSYFHFFEDFYLRDLNC